MVRRPRLIAQVVLLGALAVLAFPGEGSALRAVVIALTPTGPSRAVMTIPAGLYPVWGNQDTVTHTVVFANGECSVQLAPGDIKGCDGFGFPLGQYPYTVDGKVQASVVVVAEGREVTLHAGRNSIRRGAQVKLHGELRIPILSPPVRPAPQPVIVLARPDRYHPFRPIEVVRAKTHGWHLQWELRVRPRTHTIYIVRASSQPPEGAFWQNVWSKPLAVAVRR
jgi:hypothetical protein